MGGDEGMRFHQFRSNSRERPNAIARPVAIAFPVSSIELQLNGRSQNVFIRSEKTLP